MIVVRNIFQIEPDQMKLAIELAKQNRELSKKIGYPISRILTDLVGDFYTLVLEFESGSLAELEVGMKKIMSDPKWQKLYPQLRKLMRGGRREVFTVVA
ncbi:MAG: hypothetical protein HYS38_06480 [Acidobacteria bacterium]|nr:hypothetical protein [Acidobacteriota bacterium]